MPVFEKHFSLVEARRELPELRRIFGRVRELLAVLKKGKLEAERIQTLIRSNGHGSSHPDFGAQIAELQLLVATVGDKGIDIKDIERGLIDFPHLRDGEEVFLCWLYDEEDIQFWHTLEGGFAGRTPL